MPYVLLHDGFHSSPEVLAVGNGPAGLYARSLSYCGHHLTDGLIPAAWAKMAGSSAEIAKLLEAGMWAIDCGKDYRIHNYLEHNKSRAWVEEKRAADAERQRRSREARHAVTNTVTHAVTNAVSHTALTKPNQTEPNQTQKQTSRERSSGEGIRENAVGEEAWNGDHQPLTAEQHEQLKAFQAKRPYE